MTVAEPVQLIHPTIVVLSFVISTVLAVAPVTAATYPAGHVIYAILVCAVPEIAHFTITDYPTIAVAASFYFKAVEV